MSYEKQTWANGDVITANKLNHMEDGIAGGGGVLVVHSVYDEQTEISTLDKTWQQIHDALVAGCIVNTVQIADDEVISTFITDAWYDSGEEEGYKVDVSGVPFATDSENGYPHNSK